MPASAPVSAAGITKGNKKVPVRMGHVVHALRGGTCSFTQKEEEEGGCLCLRTQGSIAHAASTLAPIVTRNVKENSKEINKKPSDLTQLEYLFLRIY